MSCAAGPGGFYDGWGARGAGVGAEDEEASGDVSPHVGRKQYQRPVRGSCTWQNTKQSIIISSGRVMGRQDRGERSGSRLDRASPMRRHSSGVMVSAVMGPCPISYRMMASRLCSHRSVAMPPSPPVTRKRPHGEQQSACSSSDTWLLVTGRPFTVKVCSIWFCGVAEEGVLQQA